jgi:DnaK suppressor protein
MRPQVLSEFRQQLLDERRLLLEKARRCLIEENAFDANELPDEIDHASAEYAQALALRLRDREAYYLAKIEAALRKIEDGEYGICETCGEPISIARLRVRPVAPLCIRCKEHEERLERGYDH